MIDYFLFDFKVAYFVLFPNNFPRHCVDGICSIDLDNVVHILGAVESRLPLLFLVDLAFHFANVSDILRLSIIISHYDPSEKIQKSNEFAKLFVIFQATF